MDCFRDQRGFTLTELLVAIAVIGLLLAGALGIQQTSSHVYLFGSSRVETLDNARAALVRMAADIKAASLVSSNPLSASDLQFTGLDSAGVAVTIRYQLVGSDLQRTEGPNPPNPAETLIGGVEALTFSYLNSADAVTTVASAVRRIDITLRARTEQAVQAGSAGDAKSEVTTTVRLRNAL